MLGRNMEKKQTDFEDSVSLIFLYEITLVSRTIQC